MFLTSNHEKTWPGLLKPCCWLKYQGKNKEKNTGDDKEKVSYPSLLYCYVCYCTQLKMKGYAFAVFVVCLEIRDGGM